MKTFLITAWGLICGLCLSACHSSDTDNWKLVWEDNFDGASFNEAFWSKIPRGESDWNNLMSDFESCYAMRDGNLILRGIVNDCLPQDTASFLTGGLYTKGKVRFSDGRLSIRAKLNGATGAWPAIWMLPEGKQWPQGGEIDIMERLNNDTIAYQTVHSHYTYTLGIKEPESGSVGTINRDDYNIYTVEMYTDSLVFYINDARTFAYPRIETDKEGQFPFADYPFYLLIDMQLGGKWVGEVDPKDLPVEMAIDWVRFYQKGRSR